MAPAWTTLLQDLIGLAQFTVLTLEGLDPCLLLARRSRQLACITRGAPTPVPQAERRTAQLRGNCPVGSTVAAVIRTMFAEKPNAARAELGRLARSVFLVCHKAHLLRVLLSASRKHRFRAVLKQGHPQFVWRRGRIRALSRFGPALPYIAHESVGFCPLRHQSPSLGVQ
jgi:hypothetical protein